MPKTILMNFLAATLVGAVASPAQSASQSSVHGTYGQASHLVTVATNRRLNLICMGHGTPTVLFLSGLGSGAIDWRRVQPEIATVTRACSYDRAGYGYSDAAVGPSDAAGAVADLHALLYAAKLPRPVILVGHSLGGLYATLYAETYSDDVAGMVLVEPAFSGQSKAIAAAVGLAAARQLAAAQTRTLAAVDQCVALAASGRLSSPAEASSNCLDNPPNPEPEVHSERNRLDKSVAYERALRDEFQNANIVRSDEMTADDVESARAGATLGALPLAVLTRGEVNNLPGTTPEQSSRAEAGWRSGHDRLAALSTRGTNTVVPNTGHFIQLERPDVVIKKIKEVIAGSRT